MMIPDTDVTMLLGNTTCPISNQFPKVVEVAVLVNRHQHAPLPVVALACDLARDGGLGYHEQAVVCGRALEVTTGTRLCGNLSRQVAAAGLVLEGVFREQNRIRIFGYLR